MNLDPTTHVRVIAYGLCRTTGALRQIIAGICQAGDHAAIAAAVESCGSQLVTPRLLCTQPLEAPLATTPPAPLQLPAPVPQAETTIELLGGPHCGKQLPIPHTQIREIKIPHQGHLTLYLTTQESTRRGLPIFRHAPPQMA